MPKKAQKPSPGIGRRSFLKGGAGVLASATGLGVLGTAAAQANQAEQFPNYFRWDAPIYRDVRPDFTMQVGHQGPPDVYKSLEHVIAYMLKNVIERGTQGKVRVQIHPANGLGTAREQIEQTRLGVVQATIQESAVSTVYQPIQVFSIPYTFSTHAIAWAVYDSDFAREFFAEMADTVGLDVIGVGENGGFRNFTSNGRLIRSPEDMKGLKIRTQEHAGQMAMVRALGAAATPIAYSELYTALQTGVVDGQENAIPTIYQVNLQEVQDYLTLDNHIYGAYYTVVNSRWLNSLPEDFRRIVRDAGRQAAVASRGMARVSEWELLARGGQDFKEIYAPNAEEMASFRDIARPAYLEWYHDTVDRDERWSTGLFKAIQEIEERG